MKTTDPDLERLERAMEGIDKEIAFGRKLMVVVGIVNLIFALGCFVLFPLRFSTPEYLNFQSVAEVREQDDRVTATVITDCLRRGGEWNQDYGVGNTGCSLVTIPDLSWYQIPIRNPQYPQATKAIAWGLISGCAVLGVGFFLIIEGLLSQRPKRRDSRT